MLVNREKYFPNRLMLELINRYSNDHNILRKRQIKSKCSEYIGNNKFLSSLTQSTKELLVNTVGIDTDKLGDYNYQSPKPGRTYLLVTNPSDKDKGIVLHLEMREKDNSDSKEWSPKLALVLNQAFTSVEELIRKFRQEIAFKKDFRDNFRYDITDRFGKRSELADYIEGESATLPMALAILSILFKRELSVKIACTGDLSGTSIQTVNNLDEKFVALSSEYGEVKQLLSRGGKRNEEILSNDTVKFVSLENLEDVAKVFFPDYKNLFSVFTAKGAVDYDFYKAQSILLPNDQKSNIEGCEIRFNITEGERLDISYLNRLKNLGSDSTPGSKKLIIINNARASWHIGFLTAKLKNIFECIAIYDPKLSDPLGLSSAYVIQSEHNDQILLGSIIKYERGERINLSNM